MISVSQMDEEDTGRMERRFQRNTYIIIILALVVGSLLSGRRMALGVALGGALCIFNIRWLRDSVYGMLSHVMTTGSGRVPPWTASKFILRYIITALVIALAVWIGEFHPLGIGIGFAAFAGSVMVEAGYQVYRFLISSKDISE